MRGEDQPFLCCPPGTRRLKARGIGEEMLHIIRMMFVGLIVGALAKLIMPGRDPGGIFLTMLLGIAGSLAGSFLGIYVWVPGRWEMPPRPHATLGRAGSGCTTTGNGGRALAIGPLKRGSFKRLSSFYIPLLPLQSSFTEAA